MFLKKHKMLVAVFCLIMIVGIGIIFLWKAKEPDATVNQACSILENIADSDTTTKMLELIPDEVIDYNIKSGVYANEQSLENAFTENQTSISREYEVTYGSDYSISIGVDSITEFQVEDGAYSSFVKMVTDKYGWDGKDITGYAQATISKEFSGSLKTETVTDTLVLFKYKGKWYLSNFMQ